MAYTQSHGGYYADDREDGLHHMHHFVGNSMPQNSLSSLDEIDPSLLDVGFQQNNNFAFQQQQPLQRFIGESNQMGPLRGTQMYQRSVANPVSTVPHTSTRMVSPTPSMYSHGITVTSSANSPVDDSELIYDPAMYSPSTNYGFSGYAPHSHSGNHFLHDLAIPGEAAIPQYALPPNAYNCVNMSQVQVYADYGLDEGYSMHGGGGNDFIEVEQQSMKLEGGGGGNPYRYPTDEGLGTSIDDETSQRAAATPLTNINDFDADAEVDDISVAPSPASDTDYTPSSKSTRGNTMRKGKRSRDSLDSGNSVRLTSKRPRTGKTSSSPSHTSLPMPARKHSNGNSCPTCNDSFSSQNLLSKHVLKEHTKAFVCVFSFAGCSSVFATKNEWKRHVYSQHCNFYTWTCDLGDCAKPHGKSSKNAGHGGGNALIGGGAHFNRKDLYTQHLRRMHTPRGAEKGGKGSAAAQSWEDRLRSLQESNCHQTRNLPDELCCPVASCGVVFSGKNTWDERMEHVGKHLEAVAQARGAAVVNGGVLKNGIEEFEQGDDDLLVEWAIRENIVVVDPSNEGYCFVGDAPKRRMEMLAAINGERQVEEVVDEDSEDDAEGEDE